MMIEWVFGYVAGKLADAGLSAARRRFNDWREKKYLAGITTRSQEPELSLQIGRMDVSVAEPDHKLDAILREKNFPDPIRVAIAEPSLKELSELMKTGQIQQALAYAERHIKTIDAALEKDADPENRYVEALRTHRQRLLFAAASAASWQGDIEIGRAYWFRARDLGPIDSEWHKQAAITLFNVGLEDELGHLVDQMDQESELYRKIGAPCLAYLEKNWSKVEKLLADTQRADQLLHRVKARLQIIDPQDIEAVKLTAELLDQTDDDTDLPIVNLIRAQLTFDLLQRVIEGYTPLDYDRRPLINSLVLRINVALETTEPDSLFRAQALGCLGMIAEFLRDDEFSKLCASGIEALGENIRSSVFFLSDPELTSDKINILLTAGRVSTTQAAFLKAELYQTSEQPEKVELELRRALYATPDMRERGIVLRFFVKHLHQESRTDEIHRLIETIPLRPADRWLLRAENLPAGKTPLDLVNEVEAFPLDVDVVEHLAQYTLSTIKFTSPEGAPPEKPNLKRAEEAVRWTTRLVDILPSRSSRLHYARALYAAQRYEELLTISRELDPVYAEQATEFEAWSLVGLGRRSDAAAVFIRALEKYPEIGRITTNAAFFFLSDGQADKAAELLKPQVTVGLQDPDVLVLYALAIRAQAPTSRKKASQAFDLFAQAYDVRPDSEIARVALQAAQAAGREAEARRFFDAMIAEMPVKVVKTEDDFFQAMQEAGKNRGVLIEGGLEHLAKMFHEDKKRSEFLGELLHSHALSYTDFFQHSGRSSWEFWTYWTQQFEKRSFRGEISFGDFSVLADWPIACPRYDRQGNDRDAKLFLDRTAILTLSVLGPNTAGQILTALETSYVHQGILEELRRDLIRIEGHLRDGDAGPYVKVADFLRQRLDIVVTYSDEVESAAPDDPSLGPCRVDLGVAILNNAPYVTDLDNFEDWPKEVNRLRISSAALLASLNQAGEVTVDKAREAAKRHPNTFRGWDTETPLPIPEAVVFGEYSILDWVDTGLANVLGNRIKVGPWAWMRISEESSGQEAMELAHERLKDTRRVLQSALEDGILVEIKANGDAGTRESTNVKSDEEVLLIEKFWPGTLRSLRTSQAQGFQLWSDDRFYPLLLRFGGPKNMGVGVHAIRVPFVDWAEAMPPFSTMELLDQLSTAGRLSSTVAQDAAAKLFSQGYRMAHPLLLAHTLRQYPVPASDQLTPPFQKLVHAITEIPRYCTETFNGLYGNRDGFIRVASMGITERFIASVWEVEGLSDDQRCTLADAFLGAVEHVFEEVHLKSTSFRADRTPVSFWQGIAYSLQMMPVENEYRFELRFAALRWLGRAAASRVKQRKEILQVLEDNVLDSLKYAFRAFEGSVEENSLRQIISAFIVPAFIPLTDANFNGIVDPLIRRTVSTLARFTGGGRITKHYYPTADRDVVPLKLSEEEDEKAAVEVLVRMASGDPKYARFIWGIDLVFGYTHPAPKEWADTRFPSDEGIGVDVRCSLFTLLWDGPPGLRENIVRLLVYHLSVIDPVLAYQIFLIEDDLLSDDAEKAQVAHDRLGVELLQSGYLDLQRNLVHAVQRFSQYDIDAFSRFIGWIGKEAAQALASHPTAPHVWQIGSLIVPREHLLGRALLTDQFDDGHLVLERVKQLVNAPDDQDKQNTAVPKLTEWLEDKVCAAENADDPFVAAWALRAVLLSLSMVNEDLELNINGRVSKVSDWTINYMKIALAPNVSQPSEIEQRMMERRQLASASLLLASFICSGYKHREAYDQAEDPRAIWLEHVWLMATKLQVALITLRGGLSNAAKAASKVVQELELDTSNVPIIDAFDPFAFGINGDDIGIALTLTAMLKVVRQCPGANECSAWWTGTIRSLVEELVDVGSDKYIPADEEFGNRFGLTAPLRVRSIAKQLTQLTTSS